MAYIIAIDQGGSKTDIVIADHDGRIAGFADDRDWMSINGSLWHPTKQERRAARMTRIKYAAEKAAVSAGIKITDIESVSASCTGADWEFEYEIGRNNLRDTLGIEQVSLYNDCIGALRGGTEIKGCDSAIICLGTGANCAVINRERQEYIYAYYLKDAHQGAGAIGGFIFEAVFDAESGMGPETILTKLLLKETGYQSVDELFMAVTTGRTEDEIPWEPVYQEYCPLLFEAVKAGDSVAKDYLEWLCSELSRYVIIAAGKLNMRDRNITVVISGGVSKSGSLMSELIEKSLKDELSKIKCINARFEPVVGSLLLEYDRLYPNGIPKEVMRRIEQSCTEHKLFRSIDSESENS